MCYFRKSGKKNKTMLFKKLAILVVIPPAMTSQSPVIKDGICSSAFLSFVFLNCNHVFPQALWITAVIVFHVLLK